RRTHDLRPGRIHFRRGCRDQMAARRAQGHPRRGRNRRRRGARAGRSWCVPGAGVRGARGAALGAECPRADLWPDAGCLGRPSCARDARVGRLSDPDLTEAMQRDGARRADAIRVDGGMAANDWFCQFLADVLEARVERPVELETTALGAAFLAGLATGVWSDLAGLARTYSTAAVVVPRMTAARRATLIAGWRQALERALHTPSVRR